ncbi:archaellin/type IV pilin N-terminal domain-containing protein [Halobaculum sp. MBLA0143]|uniref:archaellin/type IV pilin N-terminal domain-containing protein n=1 Tax=Halobaculum sp. MBLA0143 TaxID=3079933 RepID=UPI0035261DC0
MRRLFDGASDESGQVGIGTLIVFTAMVIVATIAAGVFLDTAGFLQSKGEQTGEESVDRVTSRLRVVSVAGNITGNRNDHLTKSGGDALADGTVNTLSVTVERPPGGEEIRLRNLTVLWRGPNQTTTLYHGGTEPYAPGRAGGDGFGAGDSSTAGATAGISPVQQSDPATNPGSLDGASDPHLTYHTFSPNSDQNTLLSSDGQLASIYINVAAVESGTADDRRPADLDPLTRGDRARIVFVTGGGGRTVVQVVVPQSIGPDDIIEL